MFKEGNSLDRQSRSKIQTFIALDQTKNVNKVKIHHLFDL